MSFSRRASRWANAALVVNVSSNEFDSFQCHGPLIGVEFQVLVTVGFKDYIQEFVLASFCDISIIT